ncbi:hypothetical protein SK803_12060 [Lentzea sp. BCCO 10_0856]|uniref:Excreted virulence factor EspC, type VII ESX diderm n=1 Tax=Lentzea miocenica TaxID=3095431 RepID=A0ABU4SYR6_9PSEU|nr:hypothetical protein [Lentzea sp. BCCO 10_0856]MDX8030954.1 hypothetical protein [Lentzea sp. BCCO 10_0856]
MSEEATSWGKPARSLTSKSVQAVLGTGAADISAASKAVAAATGSGTFSVDPAVVDSMIKKLLEMQDAVADIRGKASILSQDTKLGGGYAASISQINKDFGQSATQQLKDVEREIESLRTQIEKSRASYRSVDQAHSDSLKNLNGKS